MVEAGASEPGFPTGVRALALGGGEQAAGCATGRAMRFDVAPRQSFRMYSLMGWDSRRLKSMNLRQLSIIWVRFSLSFSSESPAA